MKGDDDPGAPAPPGSATGTPFPVPGRMAAVYRAVARTTPNLDLRLLGRMLLHAALVGVAAGLAGALFVYTLDLVEHVVLSTIAGYAPLCAAGEHCAEASGATPRPWLLALMPGLGALAAGFLAHRHAPETLGGGTNATLEAFHTRGGVVRRRVAWLKMLASVLTLGFGGSGGREGPTMQLGGALGSLVGRLLSVSVRERRLLLVAGMAAGMAAVFRTPLGAALLATEVIYRDDFESDALIPSVLASVIAYSVFTFFFGEGVLFAHAPSYPFRPAQLPYYAMLAIFVSLAGIAFTRMLSFVRAKAQASRAPEWIRPAIGGLLLGVFVVPVLYLLTLTTGAEHGQRLGIMGGGYGAAQVAITGASFVPHGAGGALILLSLAVIKMVATSLTVGTGGSAGDFGPSLTIGGLLGGGFGMLMQTLDPTIDPGAFALVGMGTMYGGIAHVPLASLVLVCELTGSYELLVPLMLALGIAFVACRRVSLYGSQRESRRDSPAHSADLDVLKSLRVRDVMVRSRVFETLSRTMGTREVLRRIAQNTWQDVFPVLDQDRLVGVVTSDVLRTLAGDPELHAMTIAEDLMQPPVSAREDEDLHAVLARMLEHGLREIVVVDRRQAIIGFIDESEIGSAYHGATQEAAPPSSAAPP